jgi:hemolysin III
LLRRFDQSAIFLFIAATYTPFIVQISDSDVRWGMLAGVWAVASIGILLKTLAPGRCERATIALYLLLGWSGLIVHKSLFTALSFSTTALLVAGGLLYSGGVVFHLWQRLRFQNAIWHLFVLGAAACHYVAILRLASDHA